MSWSVYIVECADGSLYTGVTTDVGRRVDEHNGAAQGARYTRSRRPVALRYSMPCTDRGTALKEEARIKSLPRSGKERLLEAGRY